MNHSYLISYFNYRTVRQFDHSPTVKSATRYVCAGHERYLDMTGIGLNKLV